MPLMCFVLTLTAWIVATSAPPHISAAQNGGYEAASGKAEHVLSGVDVSDKIAQVVAKYGSPDDVINVAVDAAPKGSGQRDYIWQKGPTTISVTTAHYLDDNGKEVESDTYEIEVAGNSPQGEIGRTGAGLSLGDSRDRASQVYGDHFYKSQIYKSTLRGDHVPVLAIEWENGTTLCVAFDKRGRINLITLLASVD